MDCMCLSNLIQITQITETIALKESQLTIDGNFKQLILKKNAPLIRFYIYSLPITVVHFFKQGLSKYDTDWNNHGLTI